jgi:CRP-like cAMP-binding protein
MKPSFIVRSWAAMIELEAPSTAVAAVAAKLRSLGIDAGRDLEPFLRLIKVKGVMRRGVELVRTEASKNSCIVLLEGVACWSRRTDDGRRQIFAFHYPGDFCDLNRYVLPQLANSARILAVTDCLIGTVQFEHIEEIIGRLPAVGLALWRATMLEASIFRETLHNSHRPALERVAHLLCEQLARREAIGLSDGIIPLTQIDIADATALSPVHMNRTVQELRKLGALSRNTRAIKVASRERLVEIGRFDGRYLNMPKLLANWKIRLDAWLA